jgi:hypothetical protein
MQRKEDGGADQRERYIDFQGHESKIKSTTLFVSVSSLYITQQNTRSEGGRPATVCNYNDNDNDVEEVWNYYDEE